MMKDKLFADTYRTETLRLPEWDYSEPGSYFVTICTKGFRHYFGQVQENKMILNTYGKIIQQEIGSIENEGIEVDSYIIMPNHVHMIISINECYRRDNSRIISSGCGSGGSFGNSSGTVSTEEKNVLRRNMIIPKIIGKFKMQTAKQINSLRNTAGNTFWQSNYYEHVIRDQRDFDRIAIYISNNSLKRRNDEYYQ